VDAIIFTQAIASFTGAAKRLELMAKNEQTAVYRDFAHAPSKVKATIDAVKQQYPERTLIAVLELHTYSSLNEKFMDQYHGAMSMADKAVVYYSNHALELKRLPPLDAATISEGFGKDGLVVMNNSELLMEWLKAQQYENSNLLLMSSGNYDGADMLTFAKNIVEKI
jgi:UDP-N-acetylmuramate: L-alanyl-gamma-D-glutamyl-meso-diaminopimelate ligase